jgi:hypothetical protein
MLLMMGGTKIGAQWTGELSHEGEGRGRLCISKGGWQRVGGEVCQTTKARRGEPELGQYITSHCSITAHAYDLDYVAFKTLPNLFNSTCASTSSILATASMSSSRTSPRRLQLPRHSRARVDVTESRLRVWDKIRRPRLKSRSTLTDVAIEG